MRESEGRRGSGGSGICIPFLGRLRHHRGYPGSPGLKTPFKQDHGNHAVEQAMPVPRKSDVDVVSPVDHLDGPERLGHKVLDPLVPIDDKAEGGKLAGTVTDDLIFEARDPL